MEKFFRELSKELKKKNNSGVTFPLEECMKVLPKESPRRNHRMYVGFLEKSSDESARTAG